MSSGRAVLTKYSPEIRFAANLRPVCCFLFVLVAFHGLLHCDPQ